MAALTVSLRFPLGEFQAHDARGYAEWPPAPARILTAMLATAYETRNAAGVRVVRRLFCAKPPTIWTPTATERDCQVSRWVPVDPILNPRTGSIGRGGLTGTLAKPPERGTLVAKGRIVVRWNSCDLRDDEWAALDTVLADVVYLGRPTSPVVLDRYQDPVDASMMTAWIPDDTGHVFLRIATPELLAALDAREETREATGITGYHPKMAVSPMAGYRRQDLAGGHHIGVREATQGQTAIAIAHLSSYRTPGAVPDDALAVVQALGLGDEPSAVGPADVPIAAVGSDRSFALPVYGSTTKEGRETPRLFSVVTSGVPLEERVYVRGRQVVELPPPRPGVVGATAERMVRRAWGTAAAWTTLVPVEADMERLRAQVIDLRDELGAQVLDATTHELCRHPHGPRTEWNPRLVHLSVLFDHAVTGPLVFAGAVLMPFESRPDPKVNENESGPR